jgi:hypothetical protein
MSSQNFSAKARQIQGFVNRVAEKLSRESGFVQRQSKMNGVVFAQTLLVGWLKNAQASLEMLSKRARELGVEITAQGIGKRFTAEAVEYWQQMFEYCLHHFQSQATLEIPLLQQFKGVFLVDSTQVSLPKALADKWKGAGGHASPAALKMHLQFEFLSGQVSAMQLSAGASGDSAAPMTLESGSLALFDLGYFTLQRLTELEQQQVFFISRLRPNLTLFERADTQTALDLEAFCQTFVGDTFETVLYVGANERLPLRVLFARCSPAVAEARRRKANATAQRKGRQYSQHYLNLLAWSLFVTNVPQTRLTLPQVLQLYRLRWQIELLFKLCKSHLHLDSVQGCGEHRILCQLYARLILFLLLCDLVSSSRWQFHSELSFVKAFHLFSDYADRFGNLLNASPSRFALCLLDLKEDFLRFARTTPRKKSPSTLAALLDLSP